MIAGQLQPGRVESASHRVGTRVLYLLNLLVAIVGTSVAFVGATITTDGLDNLLAVALVVLGFGGAVGALLGDVVSTLWRVGFPREQDESAKP